MFGVKRARQGGKGETKIVLGMRTTTDVKVANNSNKYILRLKTLSTDDISYIFFFQNMTTYIAEAFLNNFLTLKCKGYSVNKILII